MYTERKKTQGFSWPRPAIIIAVAVVLVVVSVIFGVKSLQNARQRDRHILANRQLAWAVWYVSSTAPVPTIQDILRAGADPNARFPRWQYEDFEADYPPTPPTVTPKALPKYDAYWQDPLPILMMAPPEAVKPLVTIMATRRCCSRPGTDR